MSGPVMATSPKDLVVPAKFTDDGVPRISVGLDKCQIYWHCPACDERHLVHTRKGGWTWNGSLDKPSVMPSVLHTGFGRKGVERRCHYFVKDGQLLFLTDCSHSLAGQVVDMASVVEVEPGNGEV